MNAHRTGRPFPDPLATLGLMLFSISVAAGFARVFDGWSFLADLVVLIVVGHGVSFVLRATSVTGWLAVPLTALTLAWLVLALHHAPTFSWWLPTAETWELVRLELATVRDQFPTETAPVDYLGGWALLTTIGLAAVVLLADTFAFRADARGEALVPGGVLFVFIGAIGDERLQILLTCLLVAAGVLAVVLLRRAGESTGPVLRPERTPASLAAPAAVGVAVSVAIIAGVVGPRIPGAGAEPLLETRGRSGGVTEVVSPLVDIRSRLVSQSDTELFRVEADQDSYWRLTTLPQFDGTTFGLPTRSLQRIEGTFGTTPTGSSLLRQEIEIAALGGQLVPAAADPIEASGAGLRWNPDTSTLVNVDGDLARGARFTVVSASPRLQPSQLRTSGSSAPPDPIHLELPPGFPESVSTLAAELTDTAPTSYDAALALQQFFRTEFEYSLDVQSGHGESAIELFLAQRIGYCEQFAATFAAMARSVGLPSRVAVGYTAGLRADDGRFSVLGRNAHAWPEVWFDDVGWVAFEPTPGRGAPGTEQYTGVAPAQDETPAGGDAEESDTSADDGDDGPAPLPDEPPIDRPLLEDPSALFPDPTGGDGSGPRTPPVDDTRRPILPWLLTVGLVGLVALPAAGRRLVDARRRRASGLDQITMAWDRAVEVVRMAGVPTRPSMTAVQIASATASTFPVAARPMSSLAEIVTAVRYAPPGSLDLDHEGPFGETMSRNCSVWARQVDGIAMDHLSLASRVRRYVMFWT